MSYTFFNRGGIILKKGLLPLVTGLCFMHI